MRSQVEQKLFYPLALGCMGSWGAAEAIPFREDWTGRKGLRLLHPSGRCPRFLFCPVGSSFLGTGACFLSGLFL